MIRQWTLLRSRPLLLQRPRLHPLTLSAHSFASAAVDDSGRSDIRATTPVKHKEQDKPRKPPASDYFHLLPAAMKAFYAATGHFIVPYRLVIPRADQVVVDGRVVDAGCSIVNSTGTGISRNGVVYGHVQSVDEINWPEELRGIPFGMCVDTFAKNPKHWSAYPSVTQQLCDMSFPLDPTNFTDDQWKRIKWGQQVFAALQTYYSIHGDTLVPQEFVVPRDDPKWPMPTWGLPLGMRVNTLRNQTWLAQWKLQDMWSVDFSFEYSEALWATQVMPSLQVFHQVYDHCNVECVFVVPSSHPWPERAWGKNLGKIVQAIRIRRNYVEQADRDEEHLDAIGFVRDLVEARWKYVVLPALQMYYQEYGNSRVRQKFIVPSTHPWPERTWGLPLGVVVKTIKSQNTFAAERLRDRDALEAIKFGM